MYSPLKKKCNGGLIGYCPYATENEIMTEYAWDGGIIHVFLYENECIYGFLGYCYWDQAQVVMDGGFVGGPRSSSSGVDKMYVESTSVCWMKNSDEKWRMHKYNAPRNDTHVGFSLTATKEITPEYQVIMLTTSLNRNKRENKH